jgi:hypothetical protein
VYKFETPRYTYGEVEGALAALLGPDAQRRQIALRGRLKHFQQLGLPGLEAGKGARVRYSQEQVTQWLLALLMTELGIDPTVVIELIQRYWKTISPWVRQATDKQSRAGNPIFLTLRPRLMTGPWGEPKHPLETIGRFGKFRRYDYKLPIRRENVEMFLDHPEDGWLCTRNLTDDLIRLQTHLDRAEKAA